ncbi:retinoid-inducible serine carboxypeptidase-like [Culicoides brevitarsis]|uniref:retinoid-inducible serine carboxypeptidase-like n=1 Tax=Culicoides brevitarsis TaxID=469753 RepID=UPI00307C5EC8
MSRLVILAFAVALAAVTISAAPQAGFGPGDQDWGYVTVRPGAHMFWWLYYTTNPNVVSYTERPLVIWLQGGPGASSTGYGNFEELGPLDLFEQERNHTWVRNYNVLFVDNPVGTGFSYVDTNSALTTTNKEIALDLVDMLRGFYKHSPEFENVPLHIFSESYGGKMAAEFAYELDKAIKAGTIKCDLRSAGLGNSWISPIDSVLSWAPFLLQTGYVDVDGYNKITVAALDTKKAVDDEKWTQATDLWGYTEVVIMRETDGVDFYNILKKIYQPSVARRIASYRKGRMHGGALRDLTNFDEEINRDRVLSELMNSKVKQALRIPSNVTWGGQSGRVFSFLEGDFMKPCTEVLAKLLDETDVKVAVFTGQLDLIVATPGTVEWINRLDWSGHDGYLKAKRTSIVVNKYIEGYQRKNKNFAVYWANRAGHMVPADNPAFMDYVLHQTIGS